jgi:molybdate transport system substrate-binding protein
MATLLAMFSLPALALTPSIASAQITCGTQSGTFSSDFVNATPIALADVAFPDDGGTLTVFAAASLTDAFGEFETMLEDAHPGLDIVIETGGSQTLVTQLQEGAEADVLATANTSTMQTALDDGLVTGNPAFFTGNRLVIVTPADNPAGIASLEDLAKDGVKLVVANESVPAGMYARQALCNFDAGGSAPDGFIDQVSGNIVSEEEDVRNVLAKVQLGEADAGIVYASDAVASERAGTPLNVIEFPADVVTNAVYPIAAVAGGNTELAEAFIAAILSPEGQAILAEYGFER